MHLCYSLNHHSWYLHSTFLVIPNIFVSLHWDLYLEVFSLLKPTCSRWHFSIWGFTVEISLIFNLLTPISSILIWIPACSFLVNSQLHDFLEVSCPSPLANTFFEALMPISKSQIRYSWLYPQSHLTSCHHDIHKSGPQGHILNNAKNEFKL